MTEKLSLADYENLKVFLGKFFDWYDAKPEMPPEVHPLHVAASIEKQSMSNAKKGLQMALNDIAEDTTKWSPERVAEADARFAAEGTFTLSEVRRRYSKKYLQILKRGVIRSEIEYYLVKGIIDGGGIEPGATESTQLQAMLNDFEARLAATLKQKPPASE
ncbi:hypothetical protein ACSFA7_18130 [Variovorax sp. LT1R20]|uniref:hypothetical protein n=1 Tax=Variovorax sp. LT1R20 TaxID=3443729 RepID=UPI003F44D5B2